MQIWHIISHTVLQQMYRQPETTSKEIHMNPFSQKLRQTATKVCSPTFMPDASCHALHSLILKNIKPPKIQINMENYGDIHPSFPPVVSLGNLLPLYFFTWLSITPWNWGLSVSFPLLLLSRIQSPMLW